MLGNCKGIFRLKLPSYDKGSIWVVFIYKCLLGKYKLVITVQLLSFKNPGCVGELP